MKPAEYAKLIGRSAQFVRLACQQGQIPCIVVKHTKRHEYEILERRHDEKSKESDTGCAVRSVVRGDLDDLR